MMEAPDACSLCRGGPLRFAFRLSRGDVTRCQDCGGFMVQDTFVSAEQDRKFHEGIEERLFVQYFEPFRKGQYRQVLSRLGPAPGSRLLDVGASYGWMLEVGSDFGLDCYGVEPTPVHYEPPLSGRIVRRTLDDHAAQTGETYAIVTLWHVMEHLRDPVLAATQIHRLLSDGGHAVIGVPNARGRMYRLGLALSGAFRSQRLLEELWYTGNPNMHRYYFSEVALRHVLRTADLQVVDAYAVDAFDWRRIWSRSTNTAGRTILRAIGPAIAWSGFTANENLVVVAEKRMQP
jgi:2-polyprenyl-3-methyl-5-hydroxy-6-metoxy-1,4-benzoquinol methylase